MKKLLFILMISLGVFTLGACGESSSSDKLRVVATTTYVGDLVRNVGGDLVEVVLLMDVGVNPHDYQPRQSDTEKIVNADLLVINGLNLEEKMGQVFRQLDGDKLLILGDFVDQDDLIFEDNNEVDPHIWFDLDIWKSLALVLANKLSAIDESNRAVYQARAQAYILDLEMLNVYIQNRVSELPEEKRVLVTAHDAFAYLGRFYGFDVYAVQGISTEAEASISDIETLAQLLVDLDVNKVFWETSVPQSTVNALVAAAQALGHNVSVGGELYSDSTGGWNEGHETLIRTYRYNVDTIINAIME